MDVTSCLGPEALKAELGSDLRDARRTWRLQASALAIAKSPGDSFPVIFPDVAAREGFYRLMENEAVDWRSICGSHADWTIERSTSVDHVLVLHDTTDLRFAIHAEGVERKHLARSSRARQGFEVHLSMAAHLDGVPLGTLRVQPFVHRSELTQGEEAEAFWKSEGGWFDNERARWFEGIRDTEAALRERGVEPVHVADREGDSFPMFAWLQGEGIRHVIRVGALKRRLADGPGTLNDALADQPFVAEVRAELGARGPFRKPRAVKKHPTRKARTATIQFRAGSATVRRSHSSSLGFSPCDPEDLPELLTLQLVEAVEVDPPDGEEPVRWLLVTSESIGTPEEIVRVVEIYRRRWLIEEFIKCLKTGCRLEARQMASAPALLRVLATLLPIAWQLLLLRSAADDAPDSLWRRVMQPLTFRILQELVGRRKVPPDATCQQVLLAVASLGGHIKQNGRPGWQVLHKGWRKLSTHVEGARLMARIAGLDESTGPPGGQTEM